MCGLHAQAVGGDVTPLGRIFDAFINGRPIEQKTVQDAGRQIAEKLIGRKLTDEEYAGAVNGGGFSFTGAGGRPWYSHVAESVSGSGASSSGPDPAAEARRAKEQAELERSRKIGRARRTLGFTAKEPITPHELKERYRKLARRHHPDRGGSVAKMQEINEAMEILSKPP